MKFKSYQKIQKFNYNDVVDIEFGTCFVFPKIDGTNASVWLDNNGNLSAGSRNRTLSLDNDNGGFLKFVLENKNIKKYLEKNPTHRLYGEWLIPHSLKTYREDAWRHFYIFDVAIDKPESEIKHETHDKVIYLPYDTYKPLLEEFNLDYIPPVAQITNGTLEAFIKQLQNTIYLIEDGKGAGEGIVIKNYDFYNTKGNQCWAKIVTSNFKERHHKEMGAPEISGPTTIEYQIVKKFVTEEFCEKEFEKIKLEHGGFENRLIPKLLNIAFNTFIEEEILEILKVFKCPNINFSVLKKFLFIEVKRNLIGKVF